MAAVALTPLFGREQELDSIVGLLDDGTRLLTLMGVGGIGKTRLASAVAERIGAQGGVRVATLELAALSDPALVERTLLEALGLATGAVSDPLPVAIEFLASAPTVLFVDNCEHLVDAAAALVDALLTACPQLAVVATSRTPLSLAGETTWVVPPLSIARYGSGSLSPAAQLFFDRALRARPTLPRDPQTGDEVERLVTALEGIPLAIELAAARTRALTPHEVADALDDHLRVLRGGPRNAAARHRAMRASLDWSAQLLSAQDRALLARLSVFAGGFTQRAAEAICGDEARDGVAALVDASLVVAEPGVQRTRFRLLEFVRQYAAEQLAGDDGTKVRARHRAWFLGLATAVNPERWTFSPAKRDALEAELPNLRAAFEDALSADPVQALVLAEALGPLWRVSGRITEGIAALRAALAAADDSPSGERAAAQSMLSSLGLRRGDIELCLTAAHQALATADAASDRRQRANALSQLGIVSSLLDQPEAEAMLREAAAIAAEVGDAIIESDAAVGLAAGLCLRDAGPDFWSVIEHALALATQLCHASDVRWCLWAATVVATREGRLDIARGYLERPVPADEDDDPLLRACLSAASAQLEIVGGHGARGVAIVERELGRSRPDPAPMGTGRLRTALGFAALTDGDGDTVRRLATELLAAEQQPQALIMDGHELLMRLALVENDAAAAREHAAALATAAGEYGSPWGVAIADLGTARAALLDEDAATAEALAAEALFTLRAGGWDAAAADALEVLGWAAAVDRHGERSARLLGAAAAARKDRGLVRVPDEGDRWDVVRSLARCAAGAEAFAAAWQAGSRLPLAEAAGYALRGRGRGRRGRPRRGWPSLTPIERQIAELAAAGRSNPEIAKAVFVSRGTVKAHLSHVYNKLDVANRVELAATARARDQ